MTTSSLSTGRQKTQLKQARWEQNQVWAWTLNASSMLEPKKSVLPTTTGHFLLFWVAQTSLPQDDPFASSRYPSEETTKFTKVLPRVYQVTEKHQLGGCCNFNIPGLSWGNCPECLAVLLGSRARSISTQANRKEDTLVLFFFCFLQACKLPKKLARCKDSPHTADLHGFMLCRGDLNGIQFQWPHGFFRRCDLHSWKQPSWVRLGLGLLWKHVKRGCHSDDGCHESLVASRRRVKTRGSAGGKVPSLFERCHWCATIVLRRVSLNILSKTIPSGKRLHNCGKSPS